MLLFRRWRRVFHVDDVHYERAVPWGTPTPCRGDWVMLSTGLARPFRGKVRGVSHDLTTRTTTFYVEASTFERSETV
jgi:hypothetical protein